MKVIAVILAYNCARLIPKALAKIPADAVDEILLTDDGSKDNSYEVARSLGITAFRHTPNRGYGGNLKQGVRYALERGADYVVEIHGDGAQFDPAAIRTAMPHMKNGADLILGSRFQNPKQALENGMPYIRFLANQGLSFFDRRVLGLDLTEFHTGFRIYSRRLLETIPYDRNSNDYLFSFQIIAQAAYYNMKVVEVPVEADYKSEHTSHKLSGAAIYALQTFDVLKDFWLAKKGLRTSALFPPLDSRAATQTSSPDTCKVCGTPGLQRIYHLGDIPPVNAFPKPDEISQEKSYPLELTWCPNCTLVQLRKPVPPDELFRHYLHISAGSASNLKHLTEVADSLTQRFKIGKQTQVLEIGSNDGSLLAELKSKAGLVLGVDPAKNLASLSEAKGVTTIPEFLTEETAQMITDQHGTFNVIVALNVVPHTPDVVSLLRASKQVLAPKGTFVMEGVYIRDTVLRGEFDTVYHEHVYQFSLTSLRATFSQAGLTVVDVERIPTQGGSLRVYAMRAEESPVPSAAVTQLLAEEETAGLARPETYRALGEQFKAYRQRLRDMLAQERQNSHRIVGLGAPARGMVILNACGIGPELVDEIVDDTPLKQGRVTPGTHIPVISWEELNTRPADTYLLLSWNYRDALMERLKQSGIKGRVIVPFPTLEAIEVWPEPERARSMAS